MKNIKSTLTSTATLLAGAIVHTLVNIRLQK